MTAVCGQREADGLGGGPASALSDGLNSRCLGLGAYELEGWEDISQVSSNNQRQRSVLET